MMDNLGRTPGTGKPINPSRPIAKTFTSIGTEEVRIWVHDDELHSPDLDLMMRELATGRAVWNYRLRRVERVGQTKPAAKAQPAQNSSTQPETKPEGDKPPSLIARVFAEIIFVFCMIASIVLVARALGGSL
ncbi:MAG: hypothetical protein AAGI34_16470 [Pseudomonadota bacterium]